MTGIGQNIDSTDYDIIRAKVNTVLGIGSSTSGYGQTLLSQDANSGNQVSAKMWTALRTDMIKAKNHQMTVAVGRKDTMDGLNLMLLESGSIIKEQFRAQYDNFADILLQDKFIVAESQLSEMVMISTTRQTLWNGTLAQTITINGSPNGAGASENLRFFFNAGGRLKITASRNGISNWQNDKWTTMLNDMGNIIFNHSATINDGTIGNGSMVGYHSLTTTEQLLFNVINNGIEYKVLGKCNSSNTQIILTVYFINDYITNISGELISRIVQYKPSGSNVNVEPLSAKQIGLDLSSPATVYSITPNRTTILEGQSVTFTINTNDTPTDLIPVKTVYWKTTGTATANDFDDGLLEGSVTLNSNGTATITRTLTHDSIIEPIKYFAIQLSNGTAVLANSSAVFLSDVVNYAITAVQTEVNEGGTVQFNVTANVVNGTTLYWSTTGTTTINDFDDSVDSGQVIIQNGVGTITRNIKLDKLTDGVKTFQLNLRISASSGTIVASSEVVTINDTSLTPALYTVLVDNPIISEGGLGATFSISGGNGNDILYWTISGNIKATDFVDGQINGTIVLDSAGNGIIPVKRVKDNSTIDITRYFTIQLRENSITGKILAYGPTVTVTDSTEISVSIVPEVTQVSEGRSVTFNITSNALSGTQLYWSIEGSTGISYADFLANTGICTIFSGTASITVSITSDNTTEGYEQFRVILKRSLTDSVPVAVSEYVQIIDSSTTYIQTNIVPYPTNANGGDVVNFTIAINPILSPLPTYYWFINTTDDSIISSPLAGDVTIGSDGTAVVPVTVANNINQSGQQFYMQLYKSSSDSTIVNQSSTVYVNYAEVIIPKLVYSSTTFGTNQGRITSTINATLTGGVFNSAISVNTEMYPTYVTVSSQILNNGLVPSVILTSGNTVKFSFIGQSNPPLSNITINDILMTFKDSAFGSGSATNVIDHTKTFSAVFSAIPTYSYGISGPSGSVIAGKSFPVKFTVSPASTSISIFGYIGLELPPGITINDFIFSPNNSSNNSFIFPNNGVYNVNITAPIAMIDKTFSIQLFDGNANAITTKLTLQVKSGTVAPVVSPSGMTIDFTIYKNFTNTDAPSITTKVTVHNGMNKGVSAWYSINNNDPQVNKTANFAISNDQVVITSDPYDFWMYIDMTALQSWFKSDTTSSTLISVYEAHVTYDSTGKSIAIQSVKNTNTPMPTSANNIYGNFIASTGWFPSPTPKIPFGWTGNTTTTITAPIVNSNDVKIDVKKNFKNTNVPNMVVTVTNNRLYTGMSLFYFINGDDNSGLYQVSKVIEPNSTTLSTDMDISTLMTFFKTSSVTKVKIAVWGAQVNIQNGKIVNTIPTKNSNTEPVMPISNINGVEIITTGWFDTPTSASPLVWP